MADREWKGKGWSSTICPVTTGAISAAIRARGQKSLATCWCETCRPNTLADMRLIVCPTCGNKRCPRATHHANACTGSNAPGQKGSSWENVRQVAGEKGAV